MNINRLPLAFKQAGPKFRPMTEATSTSPAVRLSLFIIQDMETILGEWEEFAKTRIPAAETMNIKALRDHAERILRAIALDMDAPETEAERAAKSKGLAPERDRLKTAATEHGALRHLDGFDLVQVTSEFRALRATVLRLWKGPRAASADDVEDNARFNEGIDQALAESIAGYSAKINESRDTFLAVLGHDLRGPLGALSNCLHVLGRHDLISATRERMAHIAGRSVASMDGLITDLLEYTRTRLGSGIEVMKRPSDFGAFCFDVIEDARAGHPLRSFTYARSGSLNIPFDADRMRQVLGNLLANAVQHGHPESRVDLDIAEEAAHVRVTVTNRGDPIPKDALQVIFNPLVQVPRADSEPHERPATSMGLGLFIAREIVKAHSGTIEVTSSAGIGTAFTVRLPKAGAEGGGA